MKTSLSVLYSRFAHNINLRNTLFATTLFVTILGCDEPDSSLIKNSEALSIPIGNTISVNSPGTLRDAQSENSLDVLNSKFAKALAASLKDSDFRKFLKSEAEKKFDGDFDILVSKTQNMNVRASNFRDILVKTTAISPGEIDQLIKLNPKLNISIPINIERWRVDNEAPLVTFIPSNYVENKTPSFTGYDLHGVEYTIDAIKEPGVPVIVVGSNERMDYIAPIGLNRLSRTSGNYERVEYIKCPNLSDIEGWANGAPEIRFDGVIYSVAGGSAMTACSNTEYVPSRSHAKDGYTLAYWTQTQYLFRWYFDAGHGPNYYLQTFEIDDSGATQTVSVGVTYQGMTSSVQLQYKEDDKKLKGELIHSTSPSPATIADGNIEFRLEN